MLAALPAGGHRRDSPVASRYTSGPIRTLTRSTMTMPPAMNTADRICREFAHFASFRGEQDGWEAALGACRDWQGRIQHAGSQPLRFGCGAWTPAIGPKAASGR